VTGVPDGIGELFPLTLTLSPEGEGKESVTLTL